MPTGHKKCSKCQNVCGSNATKCHHCGGLFRKGPSHRTTIKQAVYQIFDEAGSTDVGSKEVARRAGIACGRKVTVDNIDVLKGQWDNDHGIFEDASSASDNGHRVFLNRAGAAALANSHEEEVGTTTTVLSPPETEGRLPKQKPVEKQDVSILLRIKEMINEAGGMDRFEEQLDLLKQLME